MRSRLTTILFLSIVAIVYQSCDSTLNIDKPEEFYKYIGRDGDQTGVDLVTNGNGEIFILGSTTSPSDGQQLYVVKTDGDGKVLWEKIYGDPGDETPKDIELMSDGNLMLVGDRTDFGTGEKGFVVYRLDAVNGGLIGTPVVSGFPNVADYANTISQTSDGFIVAGYSDNGTYKTAAIFRYDTDMLLFPSSWDFTLSQFKPGGTSGYDLVPVKVAQFNADVFYIFGYTNTSNSGGIADYNFFILATGQFNVPINGILVIPGADINSNERLTSVKAVPPQSGAGFVLTGYTFNSSGSQQDLYVARVVQDMTSASPNTPSSYLIGSPVVASSQISTVVPSGASIFPSTSSGFFLLGNQNSTGDNNFYLTKLDNDLSDAWQSIGTSRTFGGVGDDTPGVVAETSNGRILIVGTMVLGELDGQQKIVLMNLNSKGMFGE